MRSFSWEIFVEAILLFFVAILVNNKSHKKERRIRENTHPSMLLKQSIAITEKKSVKAAKDTVEPSSKAMVKTTSDVGQKETLNVVPEPQALKSKFE
tara:strand:+ start:1126 stop:1416 length:291 start_codon:yes stop_codon:yes gene_type:complete